MAKTVSPNFARIDGLYLSLLLWRWPSSQMAAVAKSSRFFWGGGLAQVQDGIDGSGVSLVERLQAWGASDSAFSLC